MSAGPGPRQYHQGLSGGQEAVGRRPGLLHRCQPGAGAERWACCYPNAPGCRVIHNQYKSKCGRGLAPDRGVSVDVTLTERLLSGASPLPPLDLCWPADFVQAHNRTGPDTSVSWARTAPVPSRTIWWTKGSWKTTGFTSSMPTWGRRRKMGVLLPQCTWMPSNP